MVNLSNIPVDNNQIFSQRDYMEIDSATFIFFDDESHQHSRLGKKKFLKRGREKLKDYNRKIEHWSNMTWGTLLNMESLREHFEEIPYKSINPSVPDSYEKQDKIDKVGVFKYTGPLRFGGIYDSAEKKFFIFWIDQKDNDIYTHIK